MTDYTPRIHAAFAKAGINDNDFAAEGSLGVTKSGATATLLAGIERASDLDAPGIERAIVGRANFLAGYFGIKPPGAR